MYYAPLHPPTTPWGEGECKAAAAAAVHLRLDMLPAILDLSERAKLIKYETRSSSAL